MLGLGRERNQETWKGSGFLVDTARIPGFFYWAMGQVMAGKQDSFLKGGGKVSWFDMGKADLILFGPWKQEWGWWDHRDNKSGYTVSA